MDSKKLQMLKNETNLAKAHLDYAMSSLRAYQSVKNRIDSIGLTDEEMKELSFNMELVRQATKVDNLLNEIEDIINT